MNLKIPLILVQLISIFGCASSPLERQNEIDKTEKRKLEADFLTKLLNYDNQESEVAKFAAAHGDDKRIRSVAEKMNSRHTEERKKIDQWRESFFADVSTPPESLKNQYLSELIESEKVGGTSGAFLEIMKRQELNGVRLAEDVAASIENPEIRHFAHRVVAIQKADIVNLETLQRSRHVVR